MQDSTNWPPKGVAVVVAVLSSLAALELWLRRWPWTLFIATFVQIAVRCDAENQFHLGNILYDIVVGTRQAQGERGRRGERGGEEEGK